MKRKGHRETRHVQSLEHRHLMCAVHAGHVVSGNLVYSEIAEGWIRQSEAGLASPTVVDSQTPAPVDRSTWITSAASTAGPVPISTTNALPTAYTTGEKDILLIRVRFSDQATTFEPQTLTNAQNMLAQLDTFFRTNSFGALSLDLTPDAADPQASTVTPVYVLPGTRAQYTAWGDGRVMTDARLVAKNPQNYAGNEGKAAYDYLLFDQYAVRFSEGPGGYLGQAYVGSRGTWLKSSSAGVAAHEFGHNLGLWHANYWDPSNDISAIGSGGNLEYGDPYDSMNSSARGGAYAYTAYHQDRLGWLNNQVQNVTTNGVYRVYAHDLGGSLQSGANYALTLSRDDAKTYWVGLRQALPDNISLANAVELHWFDTSEPNIGSQFIDTLPLTSSRSDGTIQIGRTFSDPIAGVHITPVAKGADGSLPWMDVQISFGTPADNEPAEVSLSASALNIAAGQSINFSADATDPDGDTLAYYWDFGDRTFGTTNTASVSKAFAAAGEYRVRVVVSDQHGGETSQSVLVRVGNATTNKYAGRVTDAQGNPIGGALINNGLAIDDAAYRWTYTDSDGRYTLTGVPAGIYAINAFSADHTLAPAGFANPVATGADVQSIDFTATPARYLLRGRVYNVADGGVGGVLVSDGTRSELTDNNGYFNFFNSASGHYTLTATKKGYTFADVSTTVEYAANTRVSISEEFGYVTGYINGISNTANLTVSNGYHNATISIVGQGASARGYYTLKVPVGTWTMRAIRAGSSFSPSNASPITIASGGSVSRDFTLDAVTTYAATGTVTHRGAALEGVTVTATSGGVTRQAVTDSRGGYHIPGLTNGTWAVSPALSGYTFTPASRNTTVNNAAVTVSNFATTAANPAPTVAIAAQAQQLSLTTARLTARGADDAGEQYLTYTWSMVSGPPGAAVTYSANGLSGTDDIVATFNRAGEYTIRVTIKDTQGATVTSNVTFTIAPIASALSITSRWTTVPYGETQPFIATVLDQFGQSMPTQPAFTWATSGGAITADGVYTASDYGTSTITATGGGFSASLPVVTTYPIGPGTGILQEVWTGISGNGVSALTTVINAGTAPSSTAIIDSFERTGSAGTSYGERMRGLFVAPVTGSYTFWLAADDTGELYLSTDDTPLNKQLIASVTSSTASRQWDKSASQKSAAISLVAGQRYYIEALHKQGSGSDNVAVRVQMPGNVIEETIAGHRLIPWSENPAPTVASPAQASPAEVTGSTTTLSVLGADDSGEANLTYTWAVTSKPAGAANPVFAINGTNAAKNVEVTFSAVGSYVFQVTIADAHGGSITSSVTVVVAAPPVLQSAVSRKTHGSAGTFDINLPLAGLGIECRSGGASQAYQIVFAFDQTLTSAQASVLSGVAVISGVTVSGSSVIVSLTGVADVQSLRLGVQNVTARGASALPSVAVTIGFLIGDSTGDGSVATGDVSQIRSRVAAPLTTANFRSDINADGSIATGDVSQSRSKAGNTMPLALLDDDELASLSLVHRDLLQELR